MPPEQKEDVTRQTLTLHDMVDVCFELRKRGHLFDDSLIVSLIVNL